MLERFAQKLQKTFTRTEKAPMSTGYRNDGSYSPPQRYSDNLHRYLSHGGELQTDALLKSFTHGNTANDGDLARFYFFCLVFDQIIKENVEGDLAELGVYKGNTASLLAAIARKRDVTAWLLDTYEGFDDRDISGVDSNKKDDFADTSLESVKALVGEMNVRFVKGYFPDTAHVITGSTGFCLVHLDCDLYAPFKSALEYFYDRLNPGGFLIMHDYSSLHWDGAERAVDQFFADKPESIIPVPDGAGTVAIRKSKPADRILNWHVQGLRSGFAKTWLSAADGGMSEYLGNGWSTPENWGIWGIGPVHELRLVIDAQPSGDLILEADTVAVLFGSRTRQEVGVFIGDQHVATWDFTLDKNRAIRMLTVPRAAVENVDEYPVIQLIFKPTSYEPPSRLQRGNRDDRLLGMGIYRIRYRFAWPL